MSAATIRLAAQRAPFINTLMPQPSELRATGDSIVISPSLTVSLNGATSVLLQQAALRMVRRLEDETAIQIDHTLQPSEATIEVKVADLSAARPALGVDESYSIEMRGGHLALEAHTVFGAMHGFETLLQLVQPRGADFIFPGVAIHDAPRFPWRGLMLDPARRFLAVDQVLRTIDGMSAVKLNILHWHLTDDQGFRIESMRFPRLQKLGSEGQYYTQAQVNEVVSYATARGIRVVPEFDLPGHSTTWLVGYPELGSRPGLYHVEHINHIVDAALDPTRESTYRFLDSFFTEMATLFPDEYVHIGGDESNGKDWMANPAIVAFMHQHNLKDTEALQAYFNSRLQALLKKHNKQMVGWDEILNVNLAPDVVIQNWHGAEFLVNGARQGHRGILSQPFYLDHMYSAASMYQADPVPAKTSLSPAETKLVLGGEACMWGEQVTDLIVDSRIWPRAAAVAERLWSPATVADVDDMYRRLAITSLRLDALGVNNIAGPERGLRQLGGSEEGGASLGVLASVMQPVDFHERASEQQTSPLTPIGRFVDFVRPDPPLRHDFAELVQRYLHDSDPATHELDRHQLESLFESWIEEAPALNKLSATRPLIGEIRIRRAQLPELGLLGIQALGAIEAKTAPAAEWTVSEKELLKMADLHMELVDFVVLPPLENLLEAAAKAQ